MPSSITIKLLLRLLFLLCTSSDAFILSASTKSSRGIAPIYYAENGERPSGKEVNVEAIDGHADYMDFLTQDEELCVIKFYAAWCKSCQKFGLKYQKLAVDYPDIRFGEIEFGANSRLCRSMGIQRLPSIHIYKGRFGKLEDFACGPSKFTMLVEKINAYVTKSDDELQFERTLKVGNEMAHEIVTGLYDHYTLEELEKNLLELTNKTMST